MGVKKSKHFVDFIYGIYKSSGILNRIGTESSVWETLLQWKVGGGGKESEAQVESVCRARKKFAKRDAACRVHLLVHD